MTGASTFERARRHLPPGLALGQKFAGQGAYEVRAEGASVWLSDGRRLLDFGSYAVTLLGHRPAAVVDALERQLSTLPTSTRTFANEVTPALAEALVTRVAPERLQRVWFGQGGTDVVEAALKLARLATGRLRVLAVEGGFHGKSLGALAATWNPRYRDGLLPLLSHVTHVAVDTDAVRHEVASGDVAALIVEPVQGEGGIVPLPTDVLRRWAHDARAAGVLLIADEVQVGLRRCGPLAVSVADELDPDAVLFGKPLGGGLVPLSALVCSDAMYEPLLADPFVHTSAFSGHPLSCAAGLAALDEIERLACRGDVISTLVEDGLRALADAHPRLVDAPRGRGLAWGLPCTSPAAAGHLLFEIYESGLVVSPCLGRPDVIRLLPPLVATDAEVDEALAMLGRACERADQELERQR